MGIEFAPIRLAIPSSFLPTTTAPKVRPSFTTGATPRSMGTPDTTRTAATASADPKPRLTADTSAEAGTRTSGAPRSSTTTTRSATRSSVSDSSRGDAARARVPQSFFTTPWTIAGSWARSRASRRTSSRSLATRAEMTRTDPRRADSVDWERRSAIEGTPTAVRTMSGISTAASEERRTRVDQRTGSAPQPGPTPRAGPRSEQPKARGRSPPEAYDQARLRRDSVPAKGGWATTDTQSVAGGRPLRAPAKRVVRRLSARC